MQVSEQMAAIRSASSGNWLDEDNAPGPQDGPAGLLEGSDEVYPPSFLCYRAPVDGQDKTVAGDTSGDRPRQINAAFPG